MLDFLKKHCPDDRMRRFLLSRLVIYLVVICGMALYFHFRNPEPQKQPVIKPYDGPMKVGEADLTAPSRPLVLLLVAKDSPGNWDETMSRLEEIYGEKYSVLKVDVKADDGSLEYFKIEKLPAVLQGNEDGSFSQIEMP